MASVPRVEFFFDCSSPWTYLAFHRIENVYARGGADLVWRPILVGGIFNSVNPSVYEQRRSPVPAKARYYAKDLRDWARHCGLAIGQPPVFPVNSIKAMRGALDSFFARIEQPEIKQRLRDNSQELVDRGGFGSPTMFVDGGDMYFGNDRLALVEAALARTARGVAGRA